MLTHFYRKMINSISQWLLVIQETFQPAPIPVRIRSHREESLRKVRHRKY